MAKGSVSARQLLVISVCDPLHAVKFTLLVIHDVATDTGIPKGSRVDVTLYGVSLDGFVEEVRRQ